MRSEKTKKNALRRFRLGAFFIIRNNVKYNLKTQEENHRSQGFPKFWVDNDKIDWHPNFTFQPHQRRRYSAVILQGEDDALTIDR